MKKAEIAFWDLAKYLYLAWKIDLDCGQITNDDILLISLLYFQLIVCQRALNDV